MRQQHVRDVGVVLQQIAFGEPELGPEDLAEVGEPDLLPSDGEDDVVLIAREIACSGRLSRRGMSGGELRRPRAVPHRAGDRHVVELDAVGRVPQQQAAAAHVAAADEVDRKHAAASPKICEQHVDVLRRRDAAEQHDVAVRPISRAQRPRALLERAPVRAVVRIDVAAPRTPAPPRA